MREVIFPIEKYTRGRAGQIVAWLAKRRAVHTVVGLSVFPYSKTEAPTHPISIDGKNAQAWHTHECRLIGHIAYVR